MTDYSHLLVKEYKYWQVQVFENQNYLGRCVIWCKRDDALDLTEATKEEREELFIILKQLKKTVEDVFQADWLNYAFLGNEARHLHGHFVPRYKSVREFAGITFEDKLWGHKYKTDHDFITPPEVLEAVKIKLREALEDKNNSR